MCPVCLCFYICVTLSHALSISVSLSPSVSVLSVDGLLLLLLLLLFCHYMLQLGGFVFYEDVCAGKQQVNCWNTIGWLSTPLAGPLVSIVLVLPGLGVV